MLTAQVVQEQLSRSDLGDAMSLAQSGKSSGAASGIIGMLEVRGRFKRSASSRG